MFKNLVEQAHKDGFNEIVIEVIVKNTSGKIFLVHEHRSLLENYQFPCCLLRLNETVPQALARIVTEKMRTTVKEVASYLCHRDLEDKRYYTFIAFVNDPCLAATNTSISSAWLSVQEAYGYPISEDIREVLDLYTKFEQSMR